MSATTAAPTPLPSIFDLGRHIRNLWLLYDQADREATQAKDNAKLDKENLRDRIYDERDAYAQFVLSRPAKTLGDAAVQAALVLEMLGWITESDLDYQVQSGSLERELGQIQRIVASILLAIGKNAEIDLNEIGDGNTTEYAERHSPWAAPEGALS